MNKKKNDNLSVRYYLGIDWGAKKTGLAIADNETKIATGFVEVESEKLLRRIKRLNEEYNFSQVIIGRASHQAFREEKNIEVLARDLVKLGFTVELEEEFFSTKLAQQNLAQTQKKGISKIDNIEAARIILQSWMDK